MAPPGVGLPVAPPPRCRGPRGRKGWPQAIAKRREYRTAGRNGPALEGLGWHDTGRTRAGDRTVRTGRYSPCSWASGGGRTGAPPPPWSGLRRRCWAVCQVRERFVPCAVGVPDAVGVELGAVGVPLAASLPRSRDGLALGAVVGLDLGLGIALPGLVAAAVWVGAQPSEALVGSVADAAVGLRRVVGLWRPQPLFELQRVVPDPRQADLSAVGDRRGNQPGAGTLVAALAGDVDAGEVFGHPPREVAGPAAVVVGVELDERAVRQADPPGVEAPVRPVEVQHVDDALVRALADLPERLDLLPRATARRAVTAGWVAADPSPAAGAGDPLQRRRGGRRLGGHGRASAGTSRQSGQRPSTTLQVERSQL